MDRDSAFDRGSAAPGFAQLANLRPEASLHLPATAAVAETRGTHSASAAARFLPSGSETRPARLSTFAGTPFPGSSMLPPSPSELDWKSTRLNSSHLGI